MSLVCCNWSNSWASRVQINFFTGSFVMRNLICILLNLWALNHVLGYAYLLAWVDNVWEIGWVALGKTTNSDVDSIDAWGQVLMHRCVSSTCNRSNHGQSSTRCNTLIGSCWLCYSTFSSVCLIILLVHISSLINLDRVCKVMLLIYNDFIVIVRATILIALAIFKNIIYQLGLCMTLIHEWGWVKNLLLSS